MTHPSAPSILPAYLLAIGAVASSVAAIFAWNGGHPTAAATSGLACVLMIVAALQHRRRLRGRSGA